MIDTNTANAAASILGLPENVVKNFLNLVESIEKNSSDNIQETTLQAKSTKVDLDELVNEYAQKL